jgi:hypothetical protein
VLSQNRGAQPPDVKITVYAAFPLYRPYAAFPPPRKNSRMPITYAGVMKPGAMPALPARWSR